MVTREHRPEVSPFARLVGLSPLETPGPQCEMKIEEKILNIHGTVHGGAISSLADVSMAYALWDHLKEDERTATLEMKINYVAAVTSGVLTAQANLVSRTRNVAVVETRVECGGKLVAKAMGTFYVSKTPQR